MKPPGLDAFLACFSADTLLPSPENRQFCHCLNYLSFTFDSSSTVGQFSWDTIFPQQWFPSGHWEFFNQNRTGSFFFFFFKSGHIHWCCPRSKDCLATEEFDADHLGQLVRGWGWIRQWHCSWNSDENMMPLENANPVSKMWNGKCFSLRIHFSTRSKLFALWSYCSAQWSMCCRYLQLFKTNWRKFKLTSGCQKPTVSKSGACAGCIAAFPVHVSSFTPHSEGRGP